MDQSGQIIILRIIKYSDPTKMPYIRILRVLTPLLAVSLSVVSAAGAFLPDTYERDAAFFATQGIGQDLVDLFLVVPLLLLTFYSARRDSRRGMLLYGGVLAYIMYSFVIYAFGLHFNRFFLLYCSTLGLSLYAFIVWMKGMGSLDWSGPFRGLPVRVRSVFLILVGVIFYGLWLSSVIPSIINDTVPEEILTNDFLINPVHVLDMSFALPGLIISGILLWRRQSLGYLLTAVSLVFIILLTIALGAMVLMLRIREISEEFTVAIIFGAICIVSAILLIPMLRSLKRSNQIQHSDE